MQKAVGGKKGIALFLRAREHPSGNEVSRPCVRAAAICVGIILALVMGACSQGQPRAESQPGTESPEASLAQLSDAIQARDWAGVQKYVDVDGLCAQIVDVRIGQLMRSGGPQAPEADQAQVMRPTLIQELRDEWRNDVEVAPKYKDITDVRVIFGSLKVKSVRDLGDSAIVAVETRDPFDGQAYQCELKMRRVEDFWRVVSVEGLPFLKIGN